jgi:alkylation response protein AidB-like acyl-CoA dehydrogenase
VFFDDVRVPVDSVVGDVDDGWRVARTTMMNERMAAGTMHSATEAFAGLRRLAQQVRLNGTPRAADPVVRQQLATVYAKGRLFDLTAARVRGTLARGGIPGAEVSVLKLAASIYFSELAFLGAGILGAAGTLAGPDAPDEGKWTEAVLGSFAMHIGGGTDEIQRNIIGETVLGLPREPSVDREIAFRDLAGGGR